MNVFEPLKLGRLELPNRVVMAPMTRSRAIGNLPNDLMREYYTQRASAGLIISEGIAPSPNGLGYSRIPGLFSAEQVERWRSVTAGVHAKGGRMVAQLMHTGRIGHPLNLPAGAALVSPSGVRANGQMYTDSQGPQPLGEARAMTDADIGTAKSEFVQAAKNAVAAGFDGVELHSANGYLLEQFLHPHTNRRTDRYGGSVENRNRFVVEVAREVAEAIGADRVGIRLSPYGTFNDLPSHEGVVEQYTALARSLRGLWYLHLVGSSHEAFGGTARAIREAFGGPLMLNGGFDRARADATLQAGQAELISFGRPFIANPNLVDRFKAGTPLAEPQPQTFYTPGPEGYVDYGEVASR